MHPKLIGASCACARPASLELGKMETKAAPSKGFGSHLRVAELGGDFYVLDFLYCCLRPIAQGAPKP